MNTAISSVLTANSQPSPIIYGDNGGSVSSFGSRTVASRYDEFRLSALGTTSWQSSPGPVASNFDLKELHVNALSTTKASWNRLSSQTRISLARIPSSTVTIKARYNCWPYARHASCDGRAMLEEQHPVLKLECLLVILSISPAELTTSSFGSERVTSNLVWVSFGLLTRVRSEL